MARAADSRSDDEPRDATSVDAPAAPEAPKQPTASEVRAAAKAAYAKDRILEEPDAFGHPVHVLAGALADADDGAELTKDDVDKRVAEWLSRPVVEG